MFSCERGTPVGRESLDKEDKRDPYHQPPAENYIAVFENSDLPQDAYSQGRHPVKNTVLKSGSTVRLGWLVVTPNDDSMGPTAQLIRISFPSPSGFEEGVGFIWV